MKNKNTILIPYRDREEHLNYFLENSLPLLENNLDGFKCLIIEQVGGKPFNRGKLLNIGFEYSDSEYYITQDVDLNPNFNTIKNYYNKDISINGIYCSAANTLGGVVKISKEDIFKINGFPNDYWGWGCEDKSLQNRSEYFNLTIHKNILNNDPNKSDHFKIFNDVNDRERVDFSEKTSFEYHTFSKLNNTQKESVIYKSGLNNLDYKVIKKEYIYSNVEKITVDI